MRCNNCSVRYSGEHPHIVRDENGGPTGFTCEPIGAIGWMHFAYDLEDKLDDARDEATAKLTALDYVLNGEKCDVGKDDYGYTPMLKRAREVMALLNAPEIIDFAKAVQLESAHQRERWGSNHDAGKTDADWFWLIGYLAGKALHNPPDDKCTCPDIDYSDPRERGLDPIGTDCTRHNPVVLREKRLHRIITIAAAAANWHAAKLGKTNMRPGIDTPTGETATG